MMHCYAHTAGTEAGTGLASLRTQGRTLKSTFENKMQTWEHTLAIPVIGRLRWTYHWAHWLADMTIQATERKIGNGETSKVVL